MVPQKVNRFFSVLSLSLVMGLSVSAEAPRILQAPIWVYLEPVPGTMTAEEIKAKMPPIQELDETARFVISGMLYGWRFDYTPPDKTRNVDEFFSLDPMNVIPRGDPRFELLDVKPAYPRLTCWAEFTLDSSLKNWFSYWDSVQIKSANGRGRGERTDEIAGIKKAYTNAIMQAIREYARTLDKNKPKEVLGEVLLRENPRLFADQGFFVADIKVLIHLTEIIPYSAF
jgi:hypothetical protein